MGQGLRTTVLGNLSTTPLLKKPFAGFLKTKSRRGMINYCADGVALPN